MAERSRLRDTAATVGTTQREQHPDSVAFRVVRGHRGYRRGQMHHPQVETEQNEGDAHVP